VGSWVKAADVEHELKDYFGTQEVLAVVKMNIRQLRKKPKAPSENRNIQDCNWAIPSIGEDMSEEQLKIKPYAEYALQAHLRRYSEGQTFAYIAMAKISCLTCRVIFHSARR
jgi:hypothetical protein